MSHNIINFLLNNDNEKIKKNIFTEIEEITLECKDRVGQGYFGKVYTPLISSIATVRIKNNKYVYVPIVVKELQHDGVFDYTSHDDILYLHSDREFTCEALILFFLSKFWYDSKFPYAPFLVSVHKCNEDSSAVIDTLVTERHGIAEDYIVRYRGVSIMNGTPIESISKLQSLWNLIEIGVNQYDEKYNFKITPVLLDKTMEFNLIDMLDNILLHVLIAFDYCSKKGLVLLDQHLSNIFISWVSPFVNIGERNIENIKNIYYKLDKNKYIQAPVHYIIPKIGDVGSSVLKLKKDLWIIGDLINEDNISFIKETFSGYIPSYIYLFTLLKDLLPHEIFMKTKLRNIYDNEKSIKKNYTYMIGLVDPHKFPKESELLERYFDKYITNKKPEDNNETFVIKE